MKGQYLQYNISHFEGLYVTKAEEVMVYSHQGHYFLGERVRVAHGEVHVDLTTQSVLVHKNIGAARLRRVGRHLQRFAWASTVFYYRKMRFTGKGYKIRKSRAKQSLKFYFGRSHKTYVFSGGLNFKRLSKYRLLLLANNRKRLNRIASLVLQVRPVNRYTKRGLRCTRHFILKRPGKKSTY